MFLTVFFFPLLTVFFFFGIPVAIEKAGFNPAQPSPFLFAGTGRIRVTKDKPFSSHFVQAALEFGIALSGDLGHCTLFGCPDFLVALQSSALSSHGVVGAKCFLHSFQSVHKCSQTAPRSTAYLWRPQLQGSRQQSGVLTPLPGRGCSSGKQCTGRFPGDCFGAAASQSVGISGRRLLRHVLPLYLYLRIFKPLTRHRIIVQTRF